MTLLTSWTVEHLNSSRSTIQTLEKHPWALSPSMRLYSSLPTTVYPLRVLKLQITGHNDLLQGQ